MGATASKGSNAHSVGKHVSENVATRALGGAADFAQSGVMGLAEQLKKIDLSKVAGTVDDAILHKIKVQPVCSFWAPSLVSNSVVT